jgi:hypothetical protein
MEIFPFISKYFFLFVMLGLEFRASCLLGRHYTTWATPLDLFYIGYFWDRVLWTTCLGWPWIVILLISASQVARITVFPSPTPFPVSSHYTSTRLTQWFPNEWEHVVFIFLYQLVSLNIMFSSFLPVLQRMEFHSLQRMEFHSLL